MIRLLKPLEDWDSIPTTGAYQEPRSWGPHGGIDKGCWTGTGVTAMHAGRVACRDYGDDAYGLSATVHDAGQDIFTRYGHGSEYVVADGAWVEAGDLLMLSGTSGNSTGPHLHVEGRYISTGATFDITPWLVDALPDEGDETLDTAIARADLNYDKMIDAMADLGSTIRSMNRAGDGILPEDRDELERLNQKWAGKI